VKHRSTLRTNTDVSVRSAEKCTLIVERSKEAFVHCGERLQILGLPASTLRTNTDVSVRSAEATPQRMRAERSKSVRELNVRAHNLS
jgi:hypothetical protein